VERSLDLAPCSRTSAGGQGDDEPAVRDAAAILARASAGEATEDESAALRDAGSIVARADTDEAVASEARLRYRAEGIPPLQPDEAIRPLLGEDERPLAIRRSAALDRREPPLSPYPAAGIAGDLYVTSRRLILVGRRTLTFDLVDIADVVISGERLFLVMRDGSGVTLDVGQPRLLRVQVAAAREAART
jgi:hypothetical protein